MKLFAKLLLSAAVVAAASPALAALQDKYSLPQEYLKSEQAYLKEFPQLQKVMDAMIVESERQMAKPQNDILHNRVCSAMVYDMSKAGKLSARDTYIAVAGDILHNIAKSDKEQVLTKPELLKAADAAVKKLRKAGYLKEFPEFWSDTTIFANPKLGNNLGHIHHLTGAVEAGDIMRKIGMDEKSITDLQVGIFEHSTGYWYFRAAVDKTIGKDKAWRMVFPVPENKLADYIHDADLVSQFVYESVVPEHSKWRNLASKRWGAKDTKEQGFVVYYVFQNLYNEARTDMGKRMAKQKWDQIAPELKKLMGIKPTDDPIKMMGTPAFWR